MSDPEPTHGCPTCPRLGIPMHLLMCGRCWRLVPGPIQRAVNAAYDHEAGLGSLALLNAQRSAIRAVRDRMERTT